MALLRESLSFQFFFLFEMGLFCNTSPLHFSHGDLGWEDNLEEEMITHSSFLAGRTPWAEEPGGYSPWDHKELDTTEHLSIW